jgi:DUF917 family protein
VPLTLQAADLPALARGFSLLGSGGGGSPHVGEMILRRSGAWPLVVHGPDDLDPATPCVAVGYIGSTLLLEERLPDGEPFTPAIVAIERWLGVEGAAVCSIEGAGLNGFAPLQLAGRRAVVDADCMGRALPDLDQISLLVDGLPDLVAAAPTGAGGVALVHAARAEDVERVLRTATACNGGWSGMALGGFRVGDLLEHSVRSGMRRAHTLGTAFDEARGEGPGDLAAALGGSVLGTGRVVAAGPEAGVPGVQSFDVRTDRADVLRIVARSEFIAVMRNGVVAAASPTVIVVMDAVSRAPLEVDELAVGKDVLVLRLPAPDWWSAEPQRLDRARPSRWGIDGLEEVC